MKTKVCTTALTKTTKYENGVMRYDTDTYTTSSTGSVILAAALLGFGFAVGKGIATVSCDLALVGLKKVNEKLRSKVQELERSKDVSGIPNAVEGDDDEDEE